jgi:hypothetical protein
MIIMLHIVPHARDLGFPAMQAAGVLSIIGAVSMLGRFVSGLIIDRLVSKAVMGGCFVLLLISLGWLQFAHQPWMLYLFTSGEKPVRRFIRGQAVPARITIEVGSHGKGDRRRNHLPHHKNAKSIDPWVGGSCGMRIGDHIYSIFGRITIGP